MNILEEAQSLVEGPRGDVYGHPYDDFSAVVDACRALGIDPVKNGPLHHPLYMIVVKLQRVARTEGHRDSIVDIAGYARNYEMLGDKMGIWQDENLYRGTDGKLRNEAGTVVIG